MLPSESMSSVWIVSPAMVTSPAEAALTRLSVPPEAPRWGDVRLRSVPLTVISPPTRESVFPVAVSRALSLTVIAEPASVDSHLLLEDVAAHDLDLELVERIGNRARVGIGILGNLDLLGPGRLIESIQDLSSRSVEY